MYFKLYFCQLVVDHSVVSIQDCYDVILLCIKYASYEEHWGRMLWVSYAVDLLTYVMNYRPMYLIYWHPMQWLGVLLMNCRPL